MRRQLLAVAALLALGGPAAAALPARAAATPTPSLPVPADTVDPATAVGGPRLASMGVTTDLPPGVPAPPELRDVAWLVADADTGAVIAAKAPHARLGPASTLKTLTSVVLLPRVDARAWYTATPEDARAGGTRIGLVPGLTYSGEQLFQALIMGSANDAAYLLARVGGGGIPETLELMNAEARRLGALDTVAGNPAGLDTPGQVSSAYDLALIGREALRSKDFRRYATTLEVPFPGGLASPRTPGTVTTSDAAATTTTREPPAPQRAGRLLRDGEGRLRLTYSLGNHNTLVWNYPGAIGVKNGWTDLAKRTYIGAATRGGRTYVVTEMHGLASGASWRPTAAMFDWAFRYGTLARPVGRLVDPGEATPPQTPAAGVAATPRATSGDGTVGRTGAGRAGAAAALSAGATPVLGPASPAALAGGAGLAVGLAALGWGFVLAGRGTRPVAPGPGRRRPSRHSARHRSAG